MAHITQIARKNLRTVAFLVAVTLAASACVRSSAPTESTTTTAPPEAAAPTSTTQPVVPPEPPPDDAVVTLEWTEAGLSGETFIDQLIATEQGFVAYRFFEDPQAWVSQDGIDWTAKDLVLGDGTGDPYLNSITTGGPGYLALGAGFADDDEVLWTSEDGFTWIQQDLDLQFPALEGFVAAGADSLAVGTNGMVVTGSMNRVGVDEHRFVVWTSADGSDWDLVEDPFGADAYVGEILPVGDGFVTQGFVDRPDGGEYIWLSSDGRVWDRVAADFLDGGYWAGPELVRWGDKILSAVQTEEGIRLWASTDGRAWEQLAASPLLDNTDQGNIFAVEAVAGPLGIVLIAELEPPRQSLPPVVIEKDGLTITVELETFRIEVADTATGSLLLETEVFDPDYVVINPDDSITLLHPDTGEALVTVTPEEFEQAQAKAFKEAGIEEPGFGDHEPTPMLFFSLDGQDWSSVGIEEIVGSNEFPSGVVVGSDAVILRFPQYIEEGPDDEPDAARIYGDEPEIIWVGRLTDGQ